VAQKWSLPKHTDISDRHGLVWDISGKQTSGKNMVGLC